MSKPTNLNVWATDPDAALVAPSQSFQELGFVAGSQPTAETFNFWMNLAYQWIRYFYDGSWSLITSGNTTTAADLSDGTFIRSTGSFLTDGFTPGQTIHWTGFTNAGNNAARVISTISANGKTITVVDPTGMVDEAGSGNEVAIADFSLAGDVGITGKLHAVGAALIEGDAEVDGDTLLGGSLVVSDAFTLSGQIGQNLGAGGVITDLTISDDGATFLLTSTNDISIDGIVAAAAGRTITLINMNAVKIITLKNEDAGASANNRFHLPSGNDHTVGILGGSATLRYLSSTNRWALIATS